MNYSAYEKAGEFKAGKMNWLLPQGRNIIYIIAFGDDFYVGSTKNLRRRFSQYVSSLKKGIYEAIKVQEAFNEKRQFDVYIVESDVESNELRKREEYRIRKLKPTLNTFDNDGIIHLHIKEVAASRGLLLKDVCERAGYKSLPSFYRQINNPESVNMRTLIRIAEVIGCEVGEFFASKEQPHIVCPNCGASIPIETTVSKTEE